MLTDTLIKPLTRLRLGGVLETLEMRFDQAMKDSLSHQDFLQLILQDEIQRRDASSFIKRVQRAKFEDARTFENFIFERYPSKIQQIIRGLQNNHYLTTHQNVIVMGPAGTGKSHLAQALGHLACRKGNSTLFVRANVFLREMSESRADNSWNRTFKKYLSPELLILDDFGLKAMTPQEAEDLYELIAEKVNRSSFAITSNRTVDAWVKLFPDPVMANAALDRVANNAHQIILEGDSYRKNFRPTQRET